MALRTQQRLKEVESFNKRYQIGQLVNVQRDDGTTFTTKTRSEARMLGGHTPVVWLEGIAGAYLLSRVSALVGKTYGN